MDDGRASCQVDFSVRVWRNADTQAGYIVWAAPDPDFGMEA
jgi:hypothetical protein